MVVALGKELEMRKSELQNEVIDAIYFGGGTPSVLQIEDINNLLEKIFLHYKVTKSPEITIEANPDDLSEEYIVGLSKTKINRLSIGVQSFNETDLKLMNRAHNALEAKKCLAIATQYFKNISVDLIYGIPGMTVQQWKNNIQTVLNYNIPHISSYALTVEPKTALEKLIRDKIIEQLSDNLAHQHFEILVDMLEKNDFIHYELSNFAKENYFSRNNSSYWLGKNYIGIGPSAHSFNGKSRSWNIANNNTYIKSMEANVLPSETEILSEADCYNESVMTGLRTIWGVSLVKIEDQFGQDLYNYLLKEAQKFIDNGTLTIENKTLKITSKGKFLSDGIASSLFYVT